MAKNTISFLRAGKIVEHKVANPMQTVLDYLRLERRETGTKEGCNEGDCGACTVVIGRLRDGKVHYETANSCIMLLPHLHGCELITVDDLSAASRLHPVQDAFVRHHASQCGFCTPGFVMSAFSLYHADAAPGRAAILDAFAGNLCRCTGYRPIIAATEEACAGKPDDAWSRHGDGIIAELAKLQGSDDVFCGDEQGFAAIPASEESLLQLAAKYPDATLVGGGTDVGLWITKQLRLLPRIIFTHRVRPLHAVGDRKATLSLGAATTYAEAESALGGLAPDVGAVIRRIGSRQVRNQGTIGGNIANGSPIGDMPPMLIALGSRIVLRSKDASRDIPLEDFFIAYGKQDRKPGEILWRIDIPKPRENERFFAYKLSKRFDQDISAVMAGFRFTIAGRSIASAVLAFGGMAATPKRARKTEEALGGLRLDDESSWDSRIAVLTQDFTPLSDMRASAAYRLEAAQGVLRKALMELAGSQAQSTRLEAAGGAAQTWL
ncbi:MAG: xanthine dehydrogenase small subunit [Hyphomicrobiales bacterium]